MGFREWYTPTFCLESWESIFLPGDKTIGFSLDSPQCFIIPSLNVFRKAFGGSLSLGPQYWELKGGETRRGRWGLEFDTLGVGALDFPGWRKGEGGRVPGGDGIGESVLKDESLDHFLELIFFFLFLPQMNWVSITGPFCGEGEESKCSHGDLGLPCWGGGRSVISGTVGLC